MSSQNNGHIGSSYGTWPTCQSSGYLVCRSIPLRGKTTSAVIVAPLLATLLSASHPSGGMGSTVPSPSPDQIQATCIFFRTTAGCLEHFRPIVKQMTKDEDSTRPYIGQQTEWLASEPLVKTKG